MGLGSTAKKIQMVSDRAEQMYKQVQELQDRIINLEEEVDDTHDTVKKMDHQLTEQRALLLALAEEQGLDGEQILAEVAIDDLDADDNEGTGDPADEAVGETAGDESTTSTGGE